MFTRTILKTVHPSKYHLWYQGPCSREPFSRFLPNSEEINRYLSHRKLHRLASTVYLTCQFWALPLQPQIKIWCQKHWPMGIQLSCVEDIVGKEEIARYEQFLLFPQCFQKLPVADALKWVSMELSVNPFPTKPWFLRVCRIILLKTLRENEKLLVRSNFSISQSVFYPFGLPSANFTEFKIIVCKLFHVGRV